MKKLCSLLILFIIFIICGCSNGKIDQKIDNQKQTYQKYIKYLEKINSSSDEDYPFDIKVKYDKLISDEIRYQVIIDNPKEELDNVSAIVIHNKKTDDIFPSAGIFEKKHKLIPEKKPSGIILVGYIPYEKNIKNFKCNFKIMVRYSINNKTKTVYYVTKKS